MSKTPKILAFAGSLREKSYNKRVLKVAEMFIKTHGEAETVESAATNISSSGK